MCRGAEGGDAARARHRGEARGGEEGRQLTLYRLLRGWRAADTQLLPAVRGLFAYDDRWPDRATGWAFWERGWLGPLADLGPWLLAEVQRDTGLEVAAVAYQAYRDGAGVDWHADANWDQQAILSLGVTRSFGVRTPGGEEFLRLAHGDLLVLACAVEHCVPVEDVPGERVSLVFRTPPKE